MRPKQHSGISILPVVLLLLAGLLCGCSPAGGAQSATDLLSSDSATSAPVGGSLTLAYTANDSLNPYEAKTKTNQELARLLYDGLVVLNADYTVSYRLAKSITVQGTKVTIVPAAARFSDGSPVTVQDILFSLETSMESQTLSYANDFANIKEKVLTDSGKLELTLAHEDPYFVNFLDFPILKKGSLEQQNDDNKDLPPIGSGRYVYHEQSGSYWLTANPDWIGGKVNITQLNLLNLPDEDAIAHATQVGTVDWYYSDLSDNVFPNMNGVSQMVPLNNLVYLGANMTLGLMSIRELRMGVSAAINRTSLVENAYFGVADSATGPYRSSLEEATGLQSISPEADNASAVAFLEKAGFTQTDAQGYRTNGNVSLSIRIIYNKENTARESVATQIATQLGLVGYKVTVKALSFAEYLSAIQYGHYDLYIGEMAIPDNLDLYPVLTAGGRLTFDVSESPSASEELPEGADMGSVDHSVLDTFVAVKAAYRYHTGKGSLSEMLSCINQELPIIPLCHRTGMLIYSNAVSGNPTPHPGDPFFGIEHCTVK